MALGRFDQAKTVMREADAQGINSSPSRRMSYLLAFQEGDAATMNRMLEASIGAGQTNAAHGWQAHTAAFGGEITNAHEQFRRGIQMALQGGFNEVAAQMAVEDAEVHGLVGQCREARTETAGGLLYSRDNFALERASRTLALCGADRESTALVKELRERYPEATFTQGVIVPLTEAAQAYEKGDGHRAFEILESLKASDRTTKSELWTEYLRGQSYLLLKDGPAAAAEFQSIIAHRGEYPNSPLFTLAYLGLGRATALAGDVAASRQAYLDFLRFWKNADGDLKPLAEARQEYAQLE